MSTDILTVFCTFPSGDLAAVVAKKLVEEGLVACVNLVPAVRSVYRWDGAIHDDAEVLAMMKTSEARFAELESRLVELHPAQVPEILALSVLAGHLPYLEWVRAQTPGQS